MRMIITPDLMLNQPQYPAQIDFANPICAGINWAANAGVGLLQPSIGTASQIGSPFVQKACPLGTYTYSDASAAARAIQTNISGAGNLSFMALCVRSNDTPIAGVSEVEAVWHNRQAAGASYSEFDLGNGFGLAADLNKPRFAGTAGVVNLWVNGLAQAGTNPATQILTTGQFYNVIGTGAGLPVGDGNIQLLGNESVGLYAVNGGVALIVFWNRVLGSAEIASLSANPWQVYKAQPRRIRRA